jgi:hypothetical protein
MDIGRLFGHAWGLFVKDLGPLIVGALVAGVIPTVAAVVVLALTFGLTMVTGAISSGEFHLNAGGVGVLVLGLTFVVVVAMLLTAPLYAGLVLGIVRRVREGRPMGYGDAFQGFTVFGQVAGAVVLAAGAVFLLFLVPFLVALLAVIASSWLLGALAILAGIAALVAAFYLYARWAYLLPLVVDQNESATGSLRASAALVAATGWWQTFLALVVMSLAVGVVSGVLSVIPVVGSVATLLLTPFALTYLLAMYFAARREEALVDAALRPAAASGSWPAAASWPDVSVEPLAPPTLPPTAPVSNPDASAAPSTPDPPPDQYPASP